MTTQQQPERSPLPAQVVRTSFATEQAVYGVLLVSGMLVVAGPHRASASSMLLTVIVTVVIFWAAHVYAGTVARHGIEHGRVRGIRESFRLAVTHSWGLLASAIIPCSILLIGAIGVIPDWLAIWGAMWACIAVLAMLGYIAFQRRGAPVLIRLLGALTTAAFGVVMALLKAVLH